MKTRILLFGTSAIGLILLLSYFIAASYSEAAFEAWRSLDAPPSAIKEVVAVYFDAIGDAALVTTTADSDLLQQGALPLCANAGCWQQIESIPLGNDSGELTITALCQSDVEKMAPPPGTPVWCANFTDVAFGTHFVREAHFAMLEDGGVWVWQFVPGQAVILIMIAGMVIGGMIGAFVLLALLRDKAQ